MSHTAAGRGASTPAVATALRAAAVLTVVALAWQFVTAGQFVEHPDAEGAVGLHAAGAIAVHVLSGLTTVAAALLWRAGAAVWPMVVAALVFALSFLQAYLGSHGPISVHVPGALVLTLGAVLVAGWSFTRAAASRR